MLFFILSNKCLDIGQLINVNVLKNLRCYLLMGANKIQFQDMEIISLILMWLGIYVSYPHNSDVLIISRDGTGPSKVSSQPLHFMDTVT